MKKLLFLAAAGVLLLTGCSKENDEKIPAPGSTERLGLASETDTYAGEKVANAADTRAGFDDAGKIVWKAGDQINVNGKDYPIAQAEDLSWYVEVEAADTYKAVYPASAYVSATECTLPATQTYTKGSFDPAAFCAYCEILPGGKLIFKHLGGMLRFTIKGSAKISSIALTGNNGEQLAGTGTLATGADNQKYLDISSGQTTVTLRCPDVQLTAEGVRFHMVVPVTAFAQGFKVLVTSATNDTSMTKNKTSAGAIARAQIMNMPTFDYIGAAPQIAFSTDGGATYTDWMLGTNNPAAFTTLKVKTPAGNTLNAEHLTAINAAITALPETADATVEIDLSDATYATTIFPNVFSAPDSKLKSFHFPRNITALAASCLANKPNMTTVVLPASMTAISASAFQNATALSQMGYYDAAEANGVKWGALPTGCVQIEASAFAIASGASNALTALVVPILTKVGDNAFDYRKNLKLTSGTNPNELTIQIADMVGKGAFRTTGVTQVRFQGTPLTASILDNAFDSCTALTSITWAVKTSYLSYFSTDAFAHCTALKTITISQPTEAIVIIEARPQDPFNGVPTSVIVTVPSSQLSAYRNDASWKTTGFTFR